MIQCGIDEAGRGPVIGPMVIALVCGEKETLRSMGVKDSKLLTPNGRERLFHLIERSACKVSVDIIQSSTLNEMMRQMSLNEIEYIHYSKLIAQAEGDIFLDCFDPVTERAERRFKSETGKSVVCEHKADAKYPAVSAASIIAKVTRDREIDKIKEEYGEVGSGYPSDPCTIDFLRREISRGTDISGIVRTEWATFRRIRSETGNQRLI